MEKKPNLGYYKGDRGKKSRGKRVSTYHSVEIRGKGAISVREWGEGVLPPEGKKIHPGSSCSVKFRKVALVLGDVAGKQQLHGRGNRNKTYHYTHIL